MPQIVDDDDTIPDHDEELTERDIVKSLALPSLIFIQISTVESIRMQLIRLEVERETTFQFLRFVSIFSVSTNKERTGVILEFLS